MKHFEKTGSLVNLIAMNSAEKAEMPEIGTGVTFYSWTDRDAGTVTHILDEKKMIIGVSYDRSTRSDENGMSESQNYTYETIVSENPSAYRFNKKKSKWEGVEQNDNGRWVLNRGREIGVGFRQKYHDFSF